MAHLRGFAIVEHMNDEYPMRINKYLAHKGHATRRGADEIIARGEVTINGRVASLGDVVKENDTIEVKNTKQKKYVYYAYYKPKGIITHSPEAGEKSIADSIRGRIIETVFPIGRLDKASRGLILLTNDGRITERLLSPENEHEKEYEVILDKPVNSQFIKGLERGVDIEGYNTKPAKAKKLGEQKISIVITEGKKHQIRRMCAALGYVVHDIKRTRIMNIKLGTLTPGQFRKLTEKEITGIIPSV